jgi:hypothetical protein
MRCFQVTAALVALTLLSACTSSSIATPQALSNKSWGQQEPKPGDAFPTTHPIDSGGGDVRNDFVTVTLPSGAVPSGATATVKLGTPLGRTDGPYAKESWGAPVRIDHTAPLAKPATLTWNVSSLTVQQRATAILVRWDDARGVWAPTQEALTLTGHSLVTHVSQFSVIDIISNGAADISQTFGEWTGKRAQAPTCSGKPLPAWVKAVVRPDEDLAAAIRTCVEPDAKAGVLTVRVANNRSFAQRITLTPEGAHWPWVWNGETDYSPVGSVWEVAHAALDSMSKAVIPPTKTMAFGVARPTAPGQVVITMTAQSDVTTIFADAVALTIDNLSVGGFDSPVLNAFVQALYECGGKSLLKSRPKNAKDAAVLAMDTAKGCVSAVMGTGSSELSYAVMNAFENTLRAEIAKGGTAAEKAIQAGRLTHEISARLWYLKLFDVVEYVSNQLADAFVGLTTLTLRLVGNPQVLGAWAPTCTDAAKDSNLLYRNLALQDQFADPRKELWKFPSWASAATTVVQPLTKCSATHQQAVAKDVDTTWGDKKAAAVVSKAIRDLASASGPTSVSVGFDHWGPVKLGMTERQVAAVFNSRVVDDGGGASPTCFMYRLAAPRDSVLFLVEASDGPGAQAFFVGGWGQVKGVYPRTDAGVGIGDKEAKVKAAYSGRTINVTPAPYDPQGHSVKVMAGPHDPTGTAIVFITDDRGTVVSYQAGKEPYAEYEEGCA